jgi:hypothetical protein
MAGCAPQNAINQPQTSGRGLVTDAPYQIASTAPFVATNSSSVANPVSATDSRFCPEGTGKYTTDSGIEEITFQGCDAQGRWVETIKKANGTTVQANTIFGIEIFGYMYDQKKLVDGMITVFSGKQVPAKFIEPVPAGTLVFNSDLSSESDIERAGAKLHEKTYSFKAIGMTTVATPVIAPPIYNFTISFLTKDNETGKDLSKWILSDISTRDNTVHTIPSKSILNFALPAPKQSPQVVASIP